MPYLYGVADEKFVPKSKLDREFSKVVVNPLNSFKFSLNHLILGKERVKTDIPRRFWATPDTLVELAGQAVNKLPLPNAFNWTTWDVCKWFRDIGFPQYQNTIRKNFISGRTLLLLDASTLPKIHINDFAHIQNITFCIRGLYGIEIIRFIRSISLPPRWPDTHYKIFRIKTGMKTESTRRTDLFRRFKIIRNKPDYSIHWQDLEKWLKHDPPQERELIGGIFRPSRFKVNAPPSNGLTSVQVVNEIRKNCNLDCMPPCTYHWTKKKDLKKPWILNSLDGKRQLKACPFENPACMPPCTCYWSAQNYGLFKVMSVLKMEFPKKYNYPALRRGYDISKQKREQIVNRQSI